MANNTLVIGRPSKDQIASASCQTSCSDLGHVDPLNKNELGPRRNREKVRGQIRDYILNMLGAPVLKIELDEQNIDFCIDEAMKIFEDYAPREYFTYYVFMTTPGKSVYELPPDVGVVRNVHWKRAGQFAFQASDLDGAIPVEYFYPGGAYASIQGGLIDPIQPIWGRMGEWVLYKNYEQMYSRVSSNIGGWEFVNDSHHIKLYPTPHGGQKVIVNYIQRMKDWDDAVQAIREGSLVFAKTILGRIRSKYKNPPGPGSGMVLDGDTLLQEAREDMKEWRQNLLTMWGDIFGPFLD